MSHDLGDIIALVDGREELVDEVQREPKKLRDYLCERLTEWLADDRFTSLAVAAHLPFDGGRSEIVLDRLRALAERAT